METVPRKVADRKLTVSGVQVDSAKARNAAVVEEQKALEHAQQQMHEAKEEMAAMMQSTNPGHDSERTAAVSASVDAHCRAVAAHEAVAHARQLFDAAMQQLETMHEQGSENLVRGRGKLGSERVGR